MEVLFTYLCGLYGNKARNSLAYGPVSDRYPAVDAIYVNAVHTSGRRRQLCGEYFVLRDFRARIVV